MREVLEADQRPGRQREQDPEHRGGGGGAIAARDQQPDAQRPGKHLDGDDRRDRKRRRPQLLAPAPGDPGSEHEERADGTEEERPDLLGLRDRALIGLMIDLNNQSKDLVAETQKAGNSFSMSEGAGFTLNFTPWFYVAIIALAAAAFFSYKRMQLLKR